MQKLPVGTGGYKIHTLVNPDENYIKIPSNHREQLMLIYTLHNMFGAFDKELIAIYVNIVMPIPQGMTSKHPGYSSLTSQRHKKRKQIRFLLDTYFERVPIEL
jgi:hypothetical protein